MEKLTRRSLITGLISFGIAAPAIVKLSSLMPIKVMVDYQTTPNWGWSYSVNRDGWFFWGKDAFGHKVSEFIPTIEFIKHPEKYDYYRDWEIKGIK